MSQSGKAKKWRAYGSKKKAKRGSARRDRRITVTGVTVENGIQKVFGTKRGDL